MKSNMKYIYEIINNNYFFRLLYRILTDATIQSNKSKIVILCNKQDKMMAKGSEVIKTLLEKELYVFNTVIFIVTCSLCIVF